MCVNEPYTFDKHEWETFDSWKGEAPVFSSFYISFDWPFLIATLICCLLFSDSVCPAMSTLCLLFFHALITILLLFPHSWRHKTIETLRSILYLKTCTCTCTYWKMFVSIMYFTNFPSNMGRIGDYSQFFQSDLKSSFVCSTFELQQYPVEYCMFFNFKWQYCVITLSILKLSKLFLIMKTFHRILKNSKFTQWVICIWCLKIYPSYWFLKRRICKLQRFILCP